VHCEPVKITKDSKQVSFAVRTTDKTPVGKQGNLFVLVAVPGGGGIIRHRIAIDSSLRVDAPRKKAAEPTKPAVAATGPAQPIKAPTEAKSLSRLEQLRTERQQK
jgi:hypothetical protein